MSWNIILLWQCIAIIYFIFIESRDYPSMVDYESKVITIASQTSATEITIIMNPGLSVRKMLSDFCLTVKDSNECEYFVDMFNAAYYGRYVSPYTDSDPFYDMFTIRSDVVVYLQETFHYRSYLEIGCHTNATFNIIQDMFQLAIGVDPNQGGTHRMTSDEFFATNQLTFDVIFIDGLHHSDQVAKDIENSLQVLNPGGTIVMHDCNPTTKISQLRMGEENGGRFTVDSWREGTNHWNGDTWRATLPLRLRDDLEIVIGDFDSGVGVIRKRKNTHRLQREYEEMLLLSSHSHDPLQAFTYEFFDKHRMQLHRLLSFKDLQAWLLLDYDEVMRKQSNMPSMNYFTKAAMNRYNNDESSIIGVDTLRLLIINNDDRVQLRMINATGHLHKSIDISIEQQQQQQQQHGSYEDIVVQAVESCHYLVISDDVCEDILKIGLLKLYELQHITHGSSSSSSTNMQLPMRYSFCSFMEHPHTHLMNALGDASLDEDSSLRSLHRLLMPHIFDPHLISIEDSIASTIILHSTSINPPIQKVCIIHAVTTSSSSSLEDSSRLVKLMALLESSELMDELSMVVVLNYGRAVDETIKSMYTHVLWLQVYEDESYFEVPTMRIIHKVSTHWNDSGMEVQILYLNEAAEVVRKQQQQQQQVLLNDDTVSNTSGIGNEQPLYHHHHHHHLVLRHKTSYHLLSSGEFDCVGMHYTNTIVPRFAENQWWCMSSYIAQLPILTYETSGKEEPLYWLLGSGHRVHSLEASPVHDDSMGDSRSSSRSSGSSRINSYIDESEAFYHCLQILR